MISGVNGKITGPLNVATVVNKSATFRCSSDENVTNWDYAFANGTRTDVSNNKKFSIANKTDCASEYCSELELSNVQISDEGYAVCYERGYRNKGYAAWLIVTGTKLSLSVAQFPAQVRNVKGRNT